jgi:hypothetical protein
LKRIYLIAASTALVLALVGFLGLALIPARIEQESAVVDYNQMGGFSYLLYTKPSYLYGPEPQTPAADRQYPISGISTIDFQYTFQPVKSGPISGRAAARLENPGIWQKEVVLAPEITQTDNLTLAFALDPGQMNALFGAIESETGLNAATRDITINVYLSLGSERLVQSLPVTLGNNLVEIPVVADQVVGQGLGRFDYTVKRRTVPPAQLTTAKYPAQLVDSLDFSYSYWPAKAGAAQVGIEAVLENPEIWQKQISLAPSTLMKAPVPLNFHLNLNEIRDQFNELDNQTGLKSDIRRVTILASIRPLKSDSSAEPGPAVETGPADNGSFIQRLPLAIEGNVLEISRDLEWEQGGASGRFDYALNLKPNTLFSSTTLYPAALNPTPAGPAALYDLAATPGVTSSALTETTLAADQTVFTKLVDRMDLTFNYRFQSSQPVENLNSDVSITALIEAPNVWSKSFVLSETRQSGNFDLKLAVDLASYINLLQAINTETGVFPDSYNLTIAANLHTTAESRFGAIDESFSPTLKGTITKNILQWDKKLASSQAGAIRALSTVPNARQYLGLTAAAARLGSLIWGIVLGLLGAAALALYLRAKPESSEPLQKETAAIKKKYGVRLVETLEQTNGGESKVIPLKSMEDLIKVADELAKPVLFHSPGDGPGPAEYAVLDGTTRYQFTLRDDEESPESPSGKNG